MIGSRATAELWVQLRQTCGIFLRALFLNLLAYRQKLKEKSFGKNSVGKDEKTEKRTEAGKGKEKGAADKGKENEADIKGKQTSTAHKGKCDKSKKAPDDPKSRTETAGNRPWRRTRQQCTT